jgi:hypothetical protein
MMYFDFRKNDVLFYLYSDVVFDDAQRSKYKFLLNNPSQNSIAASEEVDWAQRDAVRFANIGRFHAGANAAAEQGPLKVLYGDRKVFGAELGFGHAMGAYLPNQVLILKYGIGGGTLYREFMSPSRMAQIGQSEVDLRNGSNRISECTANVAVQNVRVGACYDAMVTSIQELLASERAIKKLVPDYLGQGFEFGGLVWIHGMSERDGPATSNPYTPGPVSSEYAVNLSGFLKDFTSDLSGMSEHTPVINEMPTVMLTPGLSCCSSYSYDYSEIEIAQLEAATNADMFSENSSRTVDRSIRVGPIFPVDTRLGYEGLVFENDPLIAPTFAINSNTPSNVKAWKSWHWFHSAKTYLDFGLSAAHALINAQDPSISLFSVGGSVTQGGDKTPPTISFSGLASDQISILANQPMPNIQAACVDDTDTNPTLLEALPVYNENWDKTVPASRIKTPNINEIGRKYILRYRCTDSSGNSSVRGLRVNVVTP